MMLRDHKLDFYALVSRCRQACWSLMLAVDQLLHCIESGFGVNETGGLLMSMEHDHISDITTNVQQLLQ